jgi:hypothetical protein
MAYRRDGELGGATRQLCPERTGAVRLKVRTNNGVKVLIGQKHWSVRSGRQLRRRETGWRAAGSERPVHKQNDAQHPQTPNETKRPG